MQIFCITVFIALATSFTIGSACIIEIVMISTENNCLRSWNDLTGRVCKARPTSNWLNVIQCCRIQCCCTLLSEITKKNRLFFHTRKKEKLSTQNSTSFALVAKRVQHVLYINDEGEYWLGASLQHTNSNSNTSLQLLQDRDCISPTHTLRKIAPLTGN